MADALQTFVFDNDDAARPLRMIVRDGAPWFVAKDVCSAIEIEQASRAVEPLDGDEVAEVSLTHISSTGVVQERSTLIVSESGLYTLILRSRQATTPGSLAHRFRRWVTGEVLPAIRQSGRYEGGGSGEATPLHELNTKLRMVEVALKLHGRVAANAVWDRLGLMKLPEAGGFGKRPGKALNGLDFVRQFLADCCVEDSGARVQARHLNEAFGRWAKANGAPAITEVSMSACLEALDIAKDREHVVFYRGLRLKHISEQLA